MLRRAAIDTSTSVSAVISPGSTASRAVQFAISAGVILHSRATIDELREVLWRPKFPKLRSDGAAVEFITAILDHCEMVEVAAPIAECRDPKDDKFLDVAFLGRAEVIITGDIHLLEMNPWRGVAMLKPMQYLACQGADQLP